MSSPPAGWYPDPEDATQDRWWDGTEWTDSRRPNPTNPAPSGTEQPTPAPQRALPEAGWYLDIDQSDVERWWDGVDWTDIRRKS